MRAPSVAGRRPSRRRSDSPPTLSLQTLLDVERRVELGELGRRLARVLAPPQPPSATARAASVTNTATMRNGVFMRPLRTARRLRAPLRLAPFPRGLRARQERAASAAGAGSGTAPGKSASFIWRNPAVEELGSRRDHRLEIRRARRVGLAERDVDVASDLGDAASRIAPAPARPAAPAPLDACLAYASTRASRRRAIIASSGSSLCSIVNRSFSAAPSGAVTISALATSSAA